MHAALAADADFHLVSKLLDIDPGGAFVKDSNGDLPLHVAMRQLASPDIIEALLDVFPEACKKRDADGLHPTQLAVYYDDDDEPAVVDALRRASNLLRRNDAKRRPRREPLDRILGKAVVAGVRAIAGAIVARRRRRKRARRARRTRRTTDDEKEDGDADADAGAEVRTRAEMETETTPEMEAFAESASNASRRRRRALFGQPKRRAPFRAFARFARRAATVAATAYGGALAATITMRIMVRRKATFRIPSTATGGYRPVVKHAEAATRREESRGTVTEPASVPVPEPGPEPEPEPVVVRIPPEHVLRIDMT